jgi:hypothetical protein
MDKKLETIDELLERLTAKMERHRIDAEYIREFFGKPKEEDRPKKLSPDKYFHAPMRSAYKKEK